MFRNKVAAHDLLSYALKTPALHLGEIASEQLQHGGTIASSSLMPTASSDVIATVFFDFVVQHDLAEALASMSSEQIQMVALCLSQLQRKPPKRVDISERLDLCRKTPAYTPATEVASPDIPHFARATIEQAGAAEHSNAQLPIIQAPVICQLCGAGF